MILTSPAARGLFRAILADPADDVPRLLLADMLEEAGDPRGTFIRVQCEIARLDMGDGHLPMGVGRETLRRRAQDLLDRHGWEWAGLIFRQLFPITLPMKNAFAYDRGFVASVTLTLDDWCGGECPQCQGSGRQQANNPFAPDFGPCPHCHGAGFTGKHGPALVLAAPIEEVTISEPLPRQWLRDLWWYDHLPEALAPFLDRQTGPHNATEEAARATLNRAALTWARQEAGLPALS